MTGAARDRLAAVVQALAAHPGGLTSGDWRRAAGLPKATFYRARTEALRRGLVVARDGFYRRRLASLADAKPPTGRRQPATLRQARAAAIAALVARFGSMRLGDVLNSVRADERHSGWSSRDVDGAVADCISAGLIVADAGEAGDLILRAVEASRDVG
jgi:hypothetical protein